MTQAESAVFAASGPAAPRPQPPARLGQLDGLRGVAALYVCVFHMMNSFPPLAAAAGENVWLLRNGWFAVDLFFALSGFVMAYVYGAVFADGATARDLKRFMLARVARLYPVHLVTLAVMVVLVAPFLLGGGRLFDPQDRYYWLGAVAALVMLHGPWLTTLTWNYPSWSISDEFHAYALFPFVFRHLRRPGAGLAAIAIGPLVVLAIALFGEQAGAVCAERAALGGCFPTNGVMSLVCALALFATGAGLHRLAANGWFSGAAGLIVAAATLALLAFRPTAPYAVLLIPALILATLQNRSLSSVFTLSPLLRLGELSYSLYMVHALVQVAVVNRLAPFAADRLWLAALLAALGVALSLGAAQLLHRFVEVPGRDAVRRLA